MSKKKKTHKIKVEEPKKRNWLAVVARLRSGAGAHEKKKYDRTEKHKADPKDE